MLGAGCSIFEAVMFELYLKQQSWSACSEMLFHGMTLCVKAIREKARVSKIPAYIRHFPLPISTQLIKNTKTLKYQ